MVVFSLVGTNVVGLSGFVYIFLLSQQHHFDPAGQSVPGISFCHLTPVWPHNFPFSFFVSPRCLCFELPVFCQNGYLCNPSPFVSWTVQRGSPQQLCTQGTSLCDLYLSLEEKTSFSIFLILTLQPVCSFQLANVLLQFGVCSSFEAYFREILYNAENIFALSPRTLFCGIFFLKREQRAVANASSLALVVSL